MLDASHSRMPFQAGYRPRGPPRLAPPARATSLARPVPPGPLRLVPPALQRCQSGGRVAVGPQ
eukprot:13725440-Alexandrium_andersonii.AAC.1